MNHRHMWMRGLALACFGTIALSAGAQSQMGTTTQQPPQSSSGMDPMGNGSLDGRTKPGATMTPGNTGARPEANATDRGSSRLYSDYKTAWDSCRALPLQQQNNCLASVTRQYSTLAPKCEHLTGPAFDNCIKATTD
jgi:hypothetical protein